MGAQFFSIDRRPEIARASGHYLVGIVSKYESDGDIRRDMSAVLRRGLGLKMGGVEERLERGQVREAVSEAVTLIRDIRQRRGNVHHIDHTTKVGARNLVRRVLDEAHGHKEIEAAQEQDIRELRRFMRKTKV